MSDRGKYLIRSEKVLRKGQVGPTHCFHCGAKLPEPELPTVEPPGSNEKIRVMVARADLGLPLNDQGDRGF